MDFVIVTLYDVDGLPPIGRGRDIERDRGIDGEGRETERGADRQIGGG